MALKTTLQQDARTRSDEFNRETIATASRQADPNAGRQLLPLLEKSGQSIRHAAESVENRGLKILLKVMAQERAAMYNSLSQAFGQGGGDPLDRANQSSVKSLQHGFEDLQSSMVVQRQGREDVTLTHLLQEEDALLAAYTTTLQGNLASSLRSTLEAQQARVLAFDTRLRAVGEGNQPIVARVFDTRIEGESSVMRLRQRGLEPSQIDAAPIAQVERPVLRTTAAPPTPRNTMVAGAFSGAIVGAIAGGALALFVALYPQVIGRITVGPLALWVVAMLVGAVFGTVFGFFIGQSRREDDISVTVDALVNGEYVVAAYPTPEQVEIVEEELQVYHARELNR